MRNIRSLAATTLAFLFSVIAAGAQAQSFPNRSLKIVVPATPGGAIDVIARLVGDKLTVALGQPVVIENKPGASNNLGTRSEEHTSELQSRFDLVCRLLLEKKKKKKNKEHHSNQ